MSKNRSTILVDRYQRKATLDEELNSYKGLRIHALGGLHEFLELKAKTYLTDGGLLLDLAAGTGAMSLRMQDSGFHVTATDYVSSNFEVKSIPFVQADLNENFANTYPNRFDAIMASEIIEHLENPRHFARECFSLLRPGGKVILSTPNLDNPGSKAAFVRSGKFFWFSDRDYSAHGHITPLTQWQIKKAFSEAGFSLHNEASFGAGASQLAGSPRLAAIAAAIKFISAQPPELSGEIYVAVFERPHS